MQGRWEAPSTPPERFNAEADFYNDLQRDYFVDMRNYLRQTLGSKSLVIATADHSHSNSGYPVLLAEQAMDVIDGHDYWEHPGEYVHKSPMVNDPLNSTVVELSRSAIAGKPYTVSEVNNPYPNDYDSEGIPILASYGLLQDWDAILWYTFEPKADPDWKPYVGDPFDISLDPVKMPELAEGALLFLRGDVEKARTLDTRSYSEQQVFDSMLLPMTDRPYFTPGFPLDLPLEHEVRISSLDGAPTQSFSDQPLANPIVSDTHQLAWYTSAQTGLKNAGMVTVDAPRTQALIGFVRANDFEDAPRCRRPRREHRPAMERRRHRRHQLGHHADAHRSGARHPHSAQSEGRTRRPAAAHRWRGSAGRRRSAGNPQRRGLDSATRRARHHLVRDHRAALAVPIPHGGFRAPRHYCTVTFTVIVCVTLPVDPAAVTVTVPVTGVVPPPPPEPVPPPLHAVTPATQNIVSTGSNRNLPHLSPRRFRGHRTSSHAAGRIHAARSRVPLAP